MFRLLTALVLVIALYATATPASTSKTVRQICCGPAGCTAGSC